MVKGPAGNGGDMGLNPGPRRPHMLWSSQVRTSQLLTLFSRAHEPQLLSPRAPTTAAQHPRAPAQQQEKPLQ